MVSSHHKKKKNIMNQKLKQICKNNLNNLNNLKENIQVIKEYKLNSSSGLLVSILLCVLKIFSVVFNCV